MGGVLWNGWVVTTKMEVYRAQASRGRNKDKRSGNRGDERTKESVGERQGGWSAACAEGESAPSTVESGRDAQIGPVEQGSREARASDHPPGRSSPPRLALAAPFGGTDPGPRSPHERRSAVAEADVAAEAACGDRQARGGVVERDRRDVAPDLRTVDAVQSQREPRVQGKQRRTG